MSIVMVVPSVTSAMLTCEFWYITPLSKTQQKGLVGSCVGQFWFEPGRTIPAGHVAAVVGRAGASGHAPRVFRRSRDAAPALRFEGQT